MPDAALPEFVSWPTFPFEGDIRVKALDEPALEEPPRQGDDPSVCATCTSPDDDYIWVADRWRVRGLDRPTGLPIVLILETRSHLDLGDLPNLLAAELGVMVVRLERAIRSLDGVARVHVNRWGDGSAHLHLWFLARPYGRLQLRGTFLSMWDSILPPVPEEQWQENLGLVAAWLGDFGGRAVAAPQRIAWRPLADLASEGALAAADDPAPAPGLAPDAGPATGPAVEGPDDGSIPVVDTLPDGSRPPAGAAPAGDDEPAGGVSEDPGPAGRVQPAAEAGLGAEAVPAGARVPAETPSADPTAAGPDPAPADAMPADAVSGDAVPGDAVPGDAVPGDAVPGEAVPVDAPAATPPRKSPARKSPARKSASTAKRAPAPTTAAGGTGSGAVPPATDTPEGPAEGPAEQS